MSRARTRARSWWADETLVAGVTFGLATEAETLDGAFQLVRGRYARRRYFGPGPSEWGRNLFPLLPCSRVFVARGGSRVVGAVTLIQDSPLGLPMDEAYPEELQRLRGRGRRLAQASTLAVEADHRPLGVAIVIRLLRLVLLDAALIARLDDLCFVLSPHHVPFYRRRLPMRQLGPVRAYWPIQGAPVVGLRLELGLIRALIRVTRAGLAPGPFYDFLFGPEACREGLARLRRDLPRAALLGWQAGGLVTPVNLTSGGDR